MKYDVCVIGLGYIGLPTSAVIASSGKRVLGVDKSSKIVDTVNSGLVHIVEPGLEEIVRENIASGFLSASLAPQRAKSYIICVPTPLNETDMTPNLSYVMDAVSELAPYLERGCLIILESTSPPGTTDAISELLSEIRPDLKFPSQNEFESDIGIAYCPERVLPGKILEELKFNDRIIGGVTKDCTSKAVNFYKHFVDGECISASSARLAEMCKLVENSFRDVNIAFANELSVICEKIDINVLELISAANRHPRVKILQPGPGVGGHCIAVDPWFIVSSDPKNSTLIRTAREVNIKKTVWTIRKINQFIENYKKLHKNTENPMIALYGLSFKPDIDDLRESAAVKIVKTIANVHEGQTFVVEPNINRLPDEIENCEFVDLNFAFENAKLHIILVAHKEFKTKPFSAENTFFAVNITGN